MKLPLREAECDALLAELVEWDGYVSSALLGVEAVTACGRYGDAYAADARAFLMDVTLLPLDHGVLDSAAELGLTGLRSLDALHLATALSVCDDVGVMVSYDHRLASAARDHGLWVVAPGA